MAIVDDAFKYGFFRQMGEFAKNIGHATMSGGFNDAWNMAKHAFGGGDLNAARHVSRNAIMMSDDGLNKATREYLTSNADVLTKASNTMGYDFTEKQMTKMLNEDVTAEMLERNYINMTNKMAEEGYLTTRGAVGLGLGAYTVGTKIAREDNNAPLIPFL